MYNEEPEGWTEAEAVEYDGNAWTSEDVIAAGAECSGCHAHAPGPSPVACGSCGAQIAPPGRNPRTDPRVGDAFVFGDDTMVVSEVLAERVTRDGDVLPARVILRTLRAWWSTTVADYARVLAPGVRFVAVAP